MKRPGAAEWRRVRAYLREQRTALTASAAAQYPEARFTAGTALASTPAWLPDAPLPLEAIRLTWAAGTRAANARPEHAGPEETGAGDTGADNSGAGPARRADGAGVAGSADWAAAIGAILPEPYRRYSAAVGDLDRPAIYADRPTYRLLAADLSGGAGALAFGRGSFFDSMDVGPAAAHEHAAARLGLLRASPPAARLSGAGRAGAGLSGTGLPGAETARQGGNRAEPLRRLAGVPAAIGQRPSNVAIAALTLRAGRRGETAAFPLHWRDPARVGHAGGLLHVVPVGIFQGADDCAASQAQDLDVWRCLVREFAEELLGGPEDYGGAVDYAGWPFARALTAARAAGTVRPWVLGLGVDPLTLAADLLTAVVIDGPVFDDLFGALVGVNAEGEIRPGIPFTEATVGALTGPGAAVPMQTAGAALLRLAWQHRRTLLGGVS